MPECFDLFGVQYSEHGYSGFAYTDKRHRVNVGDRVITDFGEGTVISVAPYMCPEDDPVKVILSVTKPAKIMKKITEEDLT